MNPVDPDTWKPADAHQVGVMIADEFSQVLQRFLATRYATAVNWCVELGADPDGPNRVMAEVLRSAADVIERGAPSR